MLVFIDIDGVLHPVRTHPADHMICLPCFEQWAARHTDIEFIITSSWRHRYPLTVLQGYFSPHVGSRIIGTTPRLYGVTMHRRYQEILAWLEKRDASACNWLAIDDSAADFPPGCAQLVRCMPDQGFDEAVASELDRRVSMLNAQQPLRRLQKDTNEGAL